MKILLLGEYSNVHATLADGLRCLGHQVTVVSNGDFWKDYPRDVDVSRKPGHLGGLLLLARILRLLPSWRGYDIVQLINPLFLELKAERLFSIYRYLQKHNRHVVMGAFGMDYYWAHTCSEVMPLRYSDFNIGKTLRHNVDAEVERADWIGTSKERLNKEIAQTCDAIVTGLYEYDVCYRPAFPDKTHFIPFPIKVDKDRTDFSFTPPLKLFIGISRGRSEYKGTDIMLRAAQRVVSNNPGKVVLRKAEGVPFEQYVKMMQGSDAILDQLYSYTPSMNPLEAMSKGIICIGGGEAENYEILGEQHLRPIINVLPSEEDVYQQIQWLADHPDQIASLKRDSWAYVSKHHDYLKVARQYESLYEHLSNKA